MATEQPVRYESIRGVRDGLREGLESQNVWRSEPDPCHSCRRVSRVHWCYAISIWLLVLVATVFCFLAMHECQTSNLDAQDKRDCQSFMVGAWFGLSMLVGPIVLSLVYVFWMFIRTRCCTRD